MKHYLLKSFFGAGIAALLAACSDNSVFCIEEPPVPASDSGSIVFTVSQSGDSSRSGSTSGSRLAEGRYLFSEKDSLYMSPEVSDISASAQSRASSITSDGLSALMMTCRRRTSANGYDYYFRNVAFTATDGLWTSDPPYWWLSDNTHFTFYGYAPSDARGVTFIADETDWQPKIIYRVPSDAGQQSDLVFNTSVPEYISSGNRTVPLTMAHALASISFITGDDMQRGRIAAVRLRNVIGSGTLNLANGQWTLDDDITVDCAANVNIQSGDNVEITGDAANTCFMLIPGSCTSQTEVELDITLPDGTKSTFAAPLSSAWEAGKKYQYTVTLYPRLNIDLLPDTQDAHYVIARTHVDASGLASGQSWQLTAAASDGADVTLLHEEQVNDFQKQGFWIDEIVENGTRTNARGTASITGSGSAFVYIFLPENVSDENRQISLSLKIEGSAREADRKTFGQYHPAWTSSGHGWEQTDDTEAEFGFDWNYTVSYGYRYSAFSLGGNSTYRNYCQSIIDENNAGAYASVDTYTYAFMRIRYCITIDYSKLSLLDYSNSRSDGLNNTLEMNKLAGVAVTNSFETVLQNILKTESGHESEEAFVKGDGTSGNPPAPTGTEIQGSPAIGECLKKNRYTLLKTTTAIDGQANTAYTPQIADSDIKWYLPAADQFDALPAEVSDPIIPGECWTSNADLSSNANAFLGNNALSPRLSRHKIRACRNRN